MSFLEETAGAAVMAGRASLASDAEKERVIDEMATEKVEDDNGDDVTGVDVVRAAV